MGSGAIYSNQRVTGVNPKNPKILGFDHDGTQHLVGVIAARLFRGHLDVKERILEPYFELIPVWKMERGKPDKCRKFLFAVE